MSMCEKSEWSLNGCLWLSQDNTVPKMKKINTHISNFDLEDEKIPREFRKHWKKTGNMFDIPIGPSAENRKPPIFKNKIKNKRKTEDIEYLLKTQN